jgi:hypothetical protein
VSCHRHLGVAFGGVPAQLDSGSRCGRVVVGPGDMDEQAWTVVEVDIGQRDRWLAARYADAEHGGAEDRAVGTEIGGFGCSAADRAAGEWLHRGVAARAATTSGQHGHIPPQHEYGPRIDGVTVARALAARCLRRPVHGRPCAVKWLPDKVALPVVRELQ